MTDRSRRQMNFGSRFVVIASVLILAMGDSGFGWGRQPSIQSNLQAVYAVKFLETPSREAPFKLDTQSTNSCPAYPLMVTALQDQQAPASQKMDLLDTRSWCWSFKRRALFTGWRAAALWQSGRDEEACNLLIDLRAASKTLAYARYAIGTAEWPRGVSYLECTAEIARQGVWVSPWAVAELYQRLGQHFEDAGEVDSAIAAYDRASYWHPGVWATPYVRKAQLLWSQGKTEEAIAWIVAGIPRSTDSTSAFYLWRELGEYLVAQGAFTDGLCAYQKAREVMDQVPSDNLPDTARRVTQEKLITLSARAGKATTCFVAYPALAAQ